MNLFVCLGFLLVTLVYWRWGKRIPPGWEKAKLVKALLIGECVCLLLAAGSLVSSKFEEAGLLFRGDAGEGDTSVDRLLSVQQGEPFEVSLVIPERKLSKTEAEEIFNQAEQELAEKFLGENDSSEYITCDVSFDDSYQDGLVSASWTLDSYKLIQSDGRLLTEKITEPSVITATVLLTVQDYERIVSFPFVVAPAEKSPEEELIERIQQQIYEEAKEPGTDLTLRLPDYLDSIPLAWSVEDSHTSIKLLMLFMVGLVLYGYGRQSDQQKQEQQRQKELRLSYAELVSTLTLMLSAGISLRKAWEKISLDNQKEGEEPSPLSKELNITRHQMAAGVSERRAVEEFGRRTGLREYKKLAALLIQYLEKGAANIASQLESEVDLAFEERKSLARIAGEEAGTKLLFPMMMQLLVVMALIIIPAFMAF